MSDDRPVLSVTKVLLSTHLAELYRVLRRAPRAWRVIWFRALTRDRVD
jgi:hypothetical protein